MLRIIIAFFICCLSNFAMCQYDRSLSKKFELSAFYGTWRIDSTAEDRTFNRRNSVNEEFMVFTESKFFKMKRIEDEVINYTTLGTYEVVSDTLKIKTLKGNPGMNFIIQLKGDLLELNGTFPVSELNSRKPTFFLSRKEDY